MMQRLRGSAFNVRLFVLQSLLACSFACNFNGREIAPGVLFNGTEYFDMNFNEKCHVFAMACAYKSKKYHEYLEVENATNIVLCNVEGGTVINWRVNLCYDADGAKHIEANNYVELKNSGLFVSNDRFEFKCTGNAQVFVGCVAPNGQRIGKNEQASIDGTTHHCASKNNVHAYYIGDQPHSDYQQ